MRKKISDRRKTQLANWIEEVTQMLEDCMKRETKMTEWESSFIQNIYEKLERYPLSEKEIHRLEQIWERLTQTH